MYFLSFILVQQMSQRMQAFCATKGYMNIVSLHRMNRTALDFNRTALDCNRTALDCNRIALDYNKLFFL